MEEPADMTGSWKKSQLILNHFSASLPDEETNNLAA
jgi:hypothetical protein